MYSLNIGNRQATRVLLEDLQKFEDLEQGAGKGGGNTEMDVMDIGCDLIELAHVRVKCVDCIEASV
jgi:hypothetical protein